MLLAYRFLLAAPDRLTAAELDAKVEKWLRDAGQGDIDFDVDDAVAKLRRLDVVEGHSAMRALPLTESLALLDRRWDDIFQHQPDDLVAPPAVPGESVANHGRLSPRLIRLRRVIDRFRGRLDGRRTEREPDGRHESSI